MSLRAIYILVSDYPNCCLFSRKFPTIENRLKSAMKDENIGEMEELAEELLED